MTLSVTNPWSFEAASAFWSDWCNKDVEAAGVAEDFQAAEDSLLVHEAETLDEAAIQLSVVIDAMIAGGRSDGLDVNVVRRAQTLIQQMARPRSLASESPAAR